MSGMIQKVMFTGPRQVEIATEASRDLQPREVRIKTMFSGISRGTEMNFYRGDAAFFKKTFDPDALLFRDLAEGTWSYPIEFGYENVGRISEVGAKANEFSPGQVVITYQPHRSEVVIDLDSRDVLLGDMPPVLLLPEGVKPDNGVFVPLLGVAFNAILDAQIIQTETVVIFGAGVVGLMALQLAKRAGAGAVYVVEPAPSRQKLAADLGADRVFDPRDGSDIAYAIRELTGGRGADVAIEVSGVYAGLQEAIRVVGYNGRVVAASWLPGAGEGLRLGEEFHLNRVRLLSSQSGGMNPLIADRWDKARRSAALLELLPKMNLEGLITHRFPINDAQQAYQLVDNNAQDLLQVILTYS